VDGNVEKFDGQRIVERRGEFEGGRKRDVVYCYSPCSMAVMRSESEWGE
jgi:hypothetical protein